jgi:hypothetical protein
MNKPRYNHELQVTLEDFLKIDLDNILEEASRDGYSGYWMVLSKYARIEADNGNEISSKVLWLLSDACSMMLKPESINEPYHPMVVMSGKRSALPEDFTNEDITFFENIVAECSNYKLQARIGDVLWLLKKPKNPIHLQITIESYKKFSLQYEDILIDSREAFERVIRLSLATKQPIEDIINILLENFHSSLVENNFHRLWINDLLFIAKVESNHYQNIIDGLEGFTTKFIEKNEFRIAREYYQASREWYKKLDDINNINRLTKEIAETFVKEVVNRTDSQMIVASYLENAIQEYRAIPTVNRQEYEAGKRIDELYHQMSNANQLALNELKLVKTEGIDISEFITQSTNAVKGKNLDEAILTLANISTNPIYEKIKKEAENLNRSFPLRSLFSSTHYSHDGRVIARRAGANLSDEESESYLESLNYQVIQQYSIHFGLALQGNILPAFQQLILEHRITRGYLIHLCSNSSIVPRNRVNIWAEGLYFGFEQNFLVAIHLLIPQIEHLIRTLLKQIPVKTTTLDGDGIEMEKGLSTLFEEEMLVDVMDKNLIIELEILLSNQIGYNLRNNLAHGLLEGSLNSTETIYLWWLCLKLVINNSYLIDRGETK